MKRCPTCSRTYADDTLRFCLEDGTPLAADAPPPTVAYSAAAPPVYAAPQPAWTPTALPLRKRKVWPWVLGGLALLGLLGGGLIAVIIGLAALGADSTNSNTSANSNNSTSNTNTTRVVIDENSNNANATPPATNVKITWIYMAHDDGKGKPGEQTQTFPASERTVHVVIQLDRAAEGTQVKFEWIAVDAGDQEDQTLKDLEYTTKALETKVFANLTVPHDWQEGDYKVDVYLNGRLARSIAYKIE